MSPNFKLVCKFVSETKTSKNRCLKKWLVVRSTCPMCMAQVVHHSVRDQHVHANVSRRQQSPSSRAEINIQSRGSPSASQSPAVSYSGFDASSSFNASSSFDRPPTPIPVMSSAPPIRVVMSTTPPNVASPGNEDEMAWVGNPPAYNVV